MTLEATLEIVMMSLRQIRGLRMQFSLRTLFIVVACIAAFWSLGSRAKVEHDAVSAIIAEGHNLPWIGLAYASDAVGDAHSRDQYWLAHLWNPVVSVVLFQRSDTDRILGNVARLRRLTSLQILDCDVSDEGLELLIGLSRLRELTIDDAVISNNGVRQLVKMQNLTSLSIVHTEITEEALPRLGALRKLRRLVVSGPISSAIASQLRSSLPRCDLCIIDQ